MEKQMRTFVAWIASVLLLVAFSSDATAQDYTGRLVRCDGCSASQMWTAAKARAATPNEVEIFVVDMTNGMMRKYVSVYDAEFRKSYFYEDQVSSSQLTAFLEFRAAWFEAIAKAGPRIELPSSQFRNVYNISGCQGCAAQWVYENRHRIANQLPFVDAVAVSFGKLRVEVGADPVKASLEFPSEYRYRVVMTTDDGGGSAGGAYCMGALTPVGFFVDPNQCFDGDGNKIPTSRSTVPGVYRFTTNTNLQRFVNLGSGTGWFLVFGRVGDFIRCQDSTCNGQGE